MNEGLYNALAEYAGDWFPLQVLRAPSPAAAFCLCHLIHDIAVVSTPVLSTAGMERIVGKLMSPLIAGDPVIDDQHPVRILVVDPSGGADLVTGATRTVEKYFQIGACNSLAQALDHVRTQLYDAIVLEPNLPDSWPANSYCRLSEEAEGVPFLILTDVQDLGFLARAAPLPFAVLAKGKAGPASIRRLLISAALRKRALTPGRDPSAQTGRDR